jgi:hypothetical protein
MYESEGIWKEMVCVLLRHYSSNVWKDSFVLQENKNKLCSGPVSNPGLPQCEVVLTTDHMAVSVIKDSK